MRLRFRPVQATLLEARILLVEDDAAIRGALADLLRREGSLVTAVAHGREALAYLRRSAAPDLILLDLMMPVMDGWEFRVEQKRDPLLAGIPVIAMSADPSAKARAIAADAYVGKPIDFDELVRRIRTVLERVAQQRAATNNRIAALGTLASGIAHEINNPLAYVMANLEVLQGRLPALEVPLTRELRELLDDTMEGAERIRRIVRQAQMVGPVQPEGLDALVTLDEALENALEQVATVLPPGTRVVKDLGATAPVRAEPARVEQLFVNLLDNAAHALPEAGGGEIRVSLKALPPDRALVEIGDSGCGIPVELRDRVFQPFFTTRPVGQGIGLGLSICAGVVTALGGEISFESEADRGTVFRVVLPVIS
jgi:signal transduction histidine kinase